LDLKDHNWRKKLAVIEVWAAYKSAKDKFQKLYSFEFDLSAFLNEHKQGNKYVTHAKKSNVVLEAKDAGLRVFVDIEIGSFNETRAS